MTIRFRPPRLNIPQPTSLRPGSTPGTAPASPSPIKSPRGGLQNQRAPWSTDGFDGQVRNPASSRRPELAGTLAEQRVPVEQAMGPALASGKHSTTAAQVLDLKAPLSHPDAPQFQKAFTALGMSEAKTAEVWSDILHGVNRQEQIRADVKANRLTPSSLDKPRPDTSNPHYEKVAHELGPHLRIEQGQGPLALWSGGYDVSKHAQLKGYSTLESTPAGRALSGLEIYKDPKAVTPMWNHLSEEFVRQNPRGPAHALMRTHDPKSVLYRQELQTLAPDRPVVFHPLVGDKLGDLQAVRPDKTLGPDSAFTSEAEARKALKDHLSQTGSESFAAQSMKLL
ncbi:hypothetical protein [Archangium violaceum]|uniref:Uncharacterized protein n=1 Tax=Archangium violaceum Cb vi76 TaxID=1406225 RepID=A0A084STB4_9BACT|nr:hypothetical protein [Archangium violaceum]KFA91699.1 hypothetical protein Q664_20390 [Archangium violaceum Cb vi76]